MSTTDSTAATAVEVEVDMLRAAGAWLKLAAERLAAGDYGQAASMAKLSCFGAEGAAERIAALADQR